MSEMERLFKVKRINDVVIAHSHKVAAVVLREVSTHGAHPVHKEDMVLIDFTDLLRCPLRQLAPLLFALGRRRFIQKVEAHNRGLCTIPLGDCAPQSHKSLFQLRIAPKRATSAARLRPTDGRVHVQNQTDFVLLRPLDILINPVEPGFFVHEGRVIFFECLVAEIKTHAIHAHLADTGKVLTVMMPARNFRVLRGFILKGDATQLNRSACPRNKVLALNLIHRLPNFSGQRIGDRSVLLGPRCQRWRWSRAGRKQRGGRQDGQSEGSAFRGETHGPIREISKALHKARGP